MSWLNTSEPPKPRIAVCLPAQAELPVEFVEKTWIPLRIAVPFCDKAFFSARGYSVILSRNALVMNALSVNADYILWVDSDMVVESVGTEEKDGKTQPRATSDPNLALATLLRALEETGEGIAAARYRAKQREGFNNAMWNHVPPEQLPPNDDKSKKYYPIADNAWTGNWLKVAVTGLGFCLMRTEIFRKMPQPWFTWDMPNTISEDFRFLEEAAKIGYGTWIHTDVRLSHLGIMKVKSDGSFSMPDI